MCVCVQYAQTVCAYTNLHSQLTYMGEEYTVFYVLSAHPLLRPKVVWKRIYIYRRSWLREYLQPGERLYADLPRLRVTDNPLSTIPAEILDTSARPDIVIVSTSEIILIELTVPYNSPDCLHNARSRKESPCQAQVLYLFI